MARMRSQKSGGHGAIIALGVVLILVVVGVGVAYEEGWLSKSSGNASAAKTCNIPNQQTITGAGSTFVNPLMSQWATSYNAYSTNEVTYNPVGSGAGITDITGKTVFFGASDAPLTYAQTKAMPDQQLTFPESAGAIAIIYNVPGVAGLKVNVAVLSGIFLGTITNWNATSIQALNTGVKLPNATIIPVHRSDGSGTTYAFTQWLSLGSTQWASQVSYATTVTWPAVQGEQAEKGSSGIAGYVSTTQYTIGYVDLNYALSNSITFAKVQNPAGNFVNPSVSSAQKAITNVTAEAGFSLPAATGNWSSVSMLNSPGSYDYPITTLTYMIVYQAPDVAYGSSMTQLQAEALWNFMNWTISSTGGQSYSGALYYVPLPAGIIALDKTTLASMTWGGTAIPACI
jgi:phosphate transport system substrate-binding protein